MTVPGITKADLVYSERQKKTGLAYLFWFFLGAFGAHNFYLNRNGLGFLYLFTLGLFGVGVLVDLFILPGRVRKRNAEIATELSVTRPA